MLTELTSHDCDDKVVDAGVEEVDAAEVDAARVDCAVVVTAGAAVAGGERGDKLDDGQLCVVGSRLPCAPCTLERQSNAHQFL